MRDLGTLGEGEFSEALAVNRAGQVVGSSSFSWDRFVQHAFLWTSGTGMQDLGTLGGSKSQAFGINEAGQVVGGSNLPDNKTRAFLWTPESGMRDLGTLGGEFSQAWGINAAGQVVGVSGLPDWTGHAFLWTPGTGMQDLGTLGGSHSEAYGINAAGQVVGSSYLTDDAVRHAFVWTPSRGMHDLGTLGGSYSEAYGINTAGYVVGYSTLPGDTAAHAFIWGPEYGMEDLFPTTGFSGAYGLSDNMQVGYAGQIATIRVGANQPPTARPLVINTEEAMAVSITLEGYDPEGASLTCSITRPPTHGVLTGTAPRLTYTPAAGYSGQDAFVYTVTDPQGLSSSEAVVSITITSANHSPGVSVGSAYIATEGRALTLTWSAVDPDGDALRYAWDFGDGSTGSGTTLPVSHVYGDNGTYTLSLSADDGKHGTDTKSTSVTVNNLAPTIGALAVPLAPVQIGSVVTASASFTDPGSVDTHTGQVQWDNGTSLLPASPGVNQTAKTITASNSALASGVYTITLKVTDKDGDLGQSTASSYVVVYDPTGSFVTGGGWIVSPNAACAASVCGFTGTGNATFGFVSKYAKGATVPSGGTEFEFTAGGLRFVSTSYAWLTVSGPLAQFKGAGTVNGVAGYQFLITAYDGNVAGGGGIDKFRIKIWNATAVVYDNQLGAQDDSIAATALGGGSIVIHK
jgi:probable HAF family extracellular repeat protein